MGIIIVNVMEMVKKEIPVFEVYFKKNYGFCIPDKDTIETIKNFSNNILEIGAGTGLWANLLHSNGVKIIATDLLNDIYTKYFQKYWMPIEKIDCVEAVKKYRDVEALMIVCPSPVDTTFFVKAIKEFRGNKVIIITEGKELYFPDPEQSWKLSWDLVESKPLSSFPEKTHLFLLERKI